MNSEIMNNYYKDIITNESSLSRKVGWRDDLAQVRRFEQLYKLVEKENQFDIADLGCGLAGFYTFLKEKEDILFTYTGYDISLEMINNAKKNIDIKNDSILKLIQKTQDISEHDFIILSGIYNMKKEITNKVWRDYILKELNIINNKSVKGFSFNLLTSYSDEEFKKDELYYAEPGFFFDYCKKNFSKNVALLHDYDEYDFTIIVRK